MKFIYIFVYISLELVDGRSLIIGASLISDFHFHPISYLMYSNSKRNLQRPNRMLFCSHCKRFFSPICIKTFKQVFVRFGCLHKSLSCENSQIPGHTSLPRNIFPPQYFSAVQILGIFIKYLYSWISLVNVSFVFWSLNFGWMCN